MIQGWHAEEWTGQCFYHQNFATLGRGEVYDARQQSMDAMMSQWRGERNDGIQFDDEKIVELETTMLGKMDLVEIRAGQNQARISTFPARPIAGMAKLVLVHQWDLDRWGL